jgi:ABC-type antimicrobial peptide transport system permease subunit
LGAHPGHIVHAALANTAPSLGAGLLIGLIASVIAVRWVSALLFEVSPRDPLVFTSVIAILGITAIAATLAPAVRALSIDPVTALRSD